IGLTGTDPFESHWQDGADVQRANPARNGLGRYQICHAIQLQHTAVMTVSPGNDACRRATDLGHLLCGVRISPRLDAAVLRRFLAPWPRPLRRRLHAAPVLVLPA